MARRGGQTDDWGSATKRVRSGKELLPPPEGSRLRHSLSPCFFTVSKVPPPRCCFDFCSPRLLLSAPSQSTRGQLRPRECWRTERNGPPVSRQRPVSSRLKCSECGRRPRKAPAADTSDETVAGRWQRQQRRPNLNAAPASRTAALPLPTSPSTLAAVVGLLNPAVATSRLASGRPGLRKVDFE